MIAIRLIQVIPRAARGGDNGPMDDAALTPQMVLLDSQQNALLGLFAALRTAAEPLRPALVDSLLEELRNHVADLEQNLLVETDRLSVTGRARIAQLRAANASLLADFARVRPQLLAGTAPLPTLQERLGAHFRAERALLEPLLNRLAWLREASYFSVDPGLRVSSWSPALEQTAGLAPGEVLGRPVEDVCGRLAGGPRLALALPDRGGGVVWYPPWTERAGPLEPARLRGLLRESYPASVRPGVEAALAQLRGVAGADGAHLYLVHPTDSSVVWPAFQQGAGKSGGLHRQILETGAARGEDDQAWVPLPGVHGLLGVLGLVWDHPQGALATALDLLRWAARPLALTLEPLLDSLGHPGESPLSPGVAARVLGLA